MPKILIVDDDPDLVERYEDGKILAKGEPTMEEVGP
jgi:hypothetical protein